MLTLNDGRSELWQWDTKRKLTVDAECSQVHFSNKVFGRSIDIDVLDGLAIIPDIMLQTDKDLFAWAFVGTAENGYTKISKVFKVNKRNKPADYVFTPPEQTTLSDLVERLDEIEKNQDPDAIKNAVENYLEQNPVESPVQSVNGKIGKVELTAEDVGAISQDDLQEATNEALAQAKASGEFDGKDGQDGQNGIDGKDGADGYTPVRGTDYWTEADKVEIVGDVLEQVGDIELPTGGRKEWKQICDITIPQGDAAVTLFLDKDSGGNAFSCEEIDILFEGIAVTDGTKNGKAWISLNPTKAGYNQGKNGFVTNGYFYYTENANYKSGFALKLFYNTLWGTDSAVSSGTRTNERDIHALEISGYGNKAFYGRVVVYGR